MPATRATRLATGVDCPDRIDAGTPTVGMDCPATVFYVPEAGHGAPSRMCRSMQFDRAASGRRDISERRFCCYGVMVYGGNPAG